MVAFSIKDSEKKVICNFYDYLIKTKINNDIYFEKHFSKNYCVIVFKYNGNDFNKFLDDFSFVVSNFILKHYESIIVKNIINSDYCYFDNEERLVIYEEFELLNKPSIIKSNKKKLCKLIKNYAMQNSFFIFTGFINFALSDYVNVLKQLVQEAVNQYIVDKEYLRFVNLLRDYVRNSISKASTIHLLYLNGTAYLIDEDGKDVDLDDFSNTYVSDISFSKNDYVLNTLVGIVPNEIIVHLLSPADQFIKTVQLIFESRVKICTSCSICKNYKKTSKNKVK